MKKLLLSLALLASVSLGLSAQTKDGKHRGGDRPKAFQELNLTVEQQQKMKALTQDFKTQQQDLRKNYQADLKAILTPEQQAKWQEMAKNREDKHFGDRGRGDKQMNLDDATKAKLKDLRANFVKEKKAIEASGLSPEAQQEKLQSLKDKFRNDSKAIIKATRPQKGDNSKV